MNQEVFTPDQFKGYAKLKPPSSLKYYLVTIVLGCIGALLLLIITIPVRDNPGLMSVSMERLLKFLSSLIIIVPGLLLFRWLYRSVRFAQIQLQSLITTFEKFGWSPQAYPKIDDQPMVPSSIIHNLDPEHNWQVPQYLRILGEFDNNPAECVWLDARYFNTSRAFVYCHVSISNYYPHTIVDGKDGLFQNDLPINKGNVEKVSLEGNLYKYFNIFTIKDCGQNALYTLPPDVLEKLYDYGTAFNIEVIGNSLYIFSQPEKLKTAEGLANFMNISLFLTRKLSKNSYSKFNKTQHPRNITDYSKNRMEVQTSIINFGREMFNL